MRRINLPMKISIPYSAVCSAVVVLLLSACGSEPVEEPYRQPNIILVITDDQGWAQVGSHGNQVLETPNLDRLVAKGVRAKRLIPPFPTMTFPSHYTMATGLYAEHHGIVSNTMYDPAFDSWFRISDSDAVTDPRWWEGEPIFMPGRHLTPTDKVLRGQNTASGPTWLQFSETTLRWPEGEV